MDKFDLAYAMRDVFPNAVGAETTVKWDRHGDPIIVATIAFLDDNEDVNAPAGDCWMFSNRLKQAYWQFVKEEFGDDPAKCPITVALLFACPDHSEPTPTQN